MLRNISDKISGNMGLIVLAAGFLALFFPALFTTWTSPKFISPLLGLVMFGMGLTLKLEDFRLVFSRPRDILAGIAQFTIMPFLAWLLTRLFTLPPDLALGVILVGCCPGGTASNVITFLARGDLALSVGMTAVSTVLAPLLTPLLTLLLAGTYTDVNPADMFMSIVWVVILPIASGFVVQHFFGKAAARLSSVLPGFSSLVIAFIVAIVVSTNSAKLLDGNLAVIAVVVLHNLCGLALGYATGRLAGMDFKKRVAISVEVGMQNSGLASSLAALHFAQNPMATIPGAVFSVWHNISGALVARLYAGRQEQNNPNQQ